MADNTNQHTDTMNVSMAAQGQTAVYQLSESIPVVLQFDTEGAVFTGRGNDLVVTSEDGGTIVFKEYLTLANQDALPTFQLISGEQVPGDVYLFAFNEMEEDSIETAAGPGAGGSGAGAYSDDAGDLFEGQSALGGQEDPSRSGSDDDLRDVDGSSSSTTGGNLTAPVAAGSLNLTMNEDGTIDIDNAQIVAQFSNTDGGPLSVTGVTVSTGNVVNNGDGTWTFTPPADFNGDVDISYTVFDGAFSATGNGSIDVTPVNDAPVAVDDSGTTDEDVALTFAPNDLVGDDTDVDGDTLTIQSVGNAVGGTVAIVDGNVVFSPTPNHNGDASFDYVVSDGNGATDTGSVSVDINAINDDPDAGNDIAGTDEDTAVTIQATDLLSNDSDLDGDSVRILSVTQSADGSVAFDANGNVVFTPNANFNGTTTFTYTLTDDNGGTDTATVTMTVDSVNDPVIAVDDDFTAPGQHGTEDTAMTFSIADLVGNDTDADLDTLTITGVSNPANGTVTFDGTTVTFTPDANYNGDASFDYTVTDNNGSSDTASVSLTFDNTNDGPVADAETVIAFEDTPLLISAATLLEGDTDIDGDTLTITSVQSPANGTATLSEDGQTITFTPAPNYHGTEASFTYTITDSNGGFSTATVTVNVNSINDDVTAVDDDYTAAADHGTEDTTMSFAVADLVGNDVDADGDPLTISAVSNPANGSVTLSADGTTVYFTPDANYNGDASFDYTVTDSNGSSDIGTVSLVIDNTNDGPVANADSFTTKEDVALELTAAQLIGNDTDIDGDSVTITSVSAIAGGNGTPVLNENGTVTFTPDANFNSADGDTASFSYTITDGNGGTSTATVTVDVTSVNDPVVAVDDSGSVDEDGSVTFNVADLVSNDVDLDMDTLSITLIGDASDGTAVLSADKTTITYTPDPNFNGSDSFQYTVSDGNGSTDIGVVSVTVNSVNDGPVAVTDRAETDEDTDVTIDPATLIANDTDIDGDNLSFVDVGTAVGGTVQIVGGQIVFSPNENYTGPASFTYTVTDGTATATGTVNVAIAAINDGPVANTDTATDAPDDPLTTAEDTALTIQAATLLANDTDVEGDTLTIQSVQGGVNGTAVLNGDGSITFTPSGNYNGPASFTYTVSDGTDTSTATVNLNVTSVNDGPEALNASFESTSFGAMDITLDASVSDVEDDASATDDLTTSVRITDLPDGGTLSYTGEVTLADGTVATWTDHTISQDDVDNGILFSDPDAFQYEATDTAPGVLVGTHNSADNAIENWGDPQPDGSYKTDLGNGVSVIVEGSGNGLQFFDAPHPSHLGAGLGIKGHSGIQDGDELTVSFDGASTSFAMVGFDGLGGHFTEGDGRLAEATWTVYRDGESDPVGSGEVWDDGTINYFENVAITADDGGPFDTIVFSTNSDSGSNWTLRYVDAEFTHDDSFSYVAVDSDGAESDPAVVNITIEPDGPINEAPTASGELTYTMAEDGSILITGGEIAAAELTDPDNSPNDYSIKTLSIASSDGQIADGQDAALQGTLTDNGDGTWTFTPDANWNGELVLDYTLTDGTNDFSGSVDVDVAAVNDLPTGNDFTVNMDSGATSVDFTIDAADAAADLADVETADGSVGFLLTDLPDHGTLEYTDASGTITVTEEMLQGGTAEVTFDQSGSFTFTPDDTFTRPASGVLLGTRTGETVDIANWGEATDNPNVRELTLDGGVTITISSDAKALTQYDEDNPSHMGFGIGDSDGQGINDGEQITVSFDGADVAVAEIGFDGLGGHFDADGSVKATATWEAYQDGQLVGSGTVAQPDDGSLFQSITIGTGEYDLGGSSFDTIVFSTDSSQGSNWELRYVDTEFATTDSLSYVPVDAAGEVGEEAVITLSENPDALTYEAPVLDLDGDGASYLQVSFVQETAGYNNMFGMYAVDDVTGEPVGDPILLINNQNSLTNDQGHVLGTLPEGAHYEYFIIARGADAYPDLQDNQLSFGTEDGKLVLLVTENGVTEQADRPVYFSQTQHNPDSLDDPDAVRYDDDGNQLPAGHFIIEQDGDAIIVRAEDLAGGGDNDYRDVVVRVETVQSGDGTDYSATFIEDAGSVAISTAGISITDADSTAMKSATIVLENPDAAGDDTFFIGNLPDSITASGPELVDGKLVVTLTATSEDGLASSADFEQAINSVKFYNDSEDPQEGQRDITVTVTDDADLSGSATATIEVYARNDAPTFNFEDTTGDNLIVNGSFEFATVDADGNGATAMTVESNPDNGVDNSAWAGGQAPAGWTLDAGNRWEVMGTGRHGIRVDSPDGTDNVIDTGVGNVALVISQDISDLTPGASYVIQLDLFDRSDNLGGDDSGSLDISFGGEVVASLNPGDEAWETGTVTVTVPSDSDGTETLTLTSHDNDSYGMVIDNVRMYALENVNSASVAENSAPGTFVATASGSDVEGDAITYTIATADSPFVIDATTGDITVADGAVLDFESGTTSYTIGVRATDSGGASSYRSLTITVENVNEAPVAGDVTLDNIAEDATGSDALTFTLADLVGTDADPDGDPVSITDLTVAEGAGTITETGTNQWTFTPAENYNGPVEISYNVSDNQLSTPGTASFEITPVDDGPSLTIDTAARGEDSDFITNGSFEFASLDGDGTPMTVESNPDNGVDNSAWAGGQAPAGWTLVEGDRWEVMGTGRHGIRIDSPDGTDNVIDTGVGNNEALVISQNIDGLTVGQDYVIELNLFDRSDNLGGDDSGSLDVYFGGELVATLNPGDDAWETGSITVTANSASAELMLASHDADSYGMVIDNVRMHAVEPAQANTVDIAEDATGGTFVARAVGSDVDSTDIDYTLLDANGDPLADDFPFAINSDGTISLKSGASLDHETIDSYTVTVQAEADGQVAEQTLTINVGDVNEAPSIINVSAPVETYDDGAVTGWTGDVQTTQDDDVSDFLGRFSTGDEIQKVFAVAEDASTVTIEFDLYEIDSWDQFGETHQYGNDDVIITVNGEEITIPLEVGRNDYIDEDDALREGTTEGGIDWSVDPLDDGTANLGLGGGDMDQIYHVVLTIPNPDGPVTLGFSTTANEGVNNESFGIDNLNVAAVDNTGGATFAVMEDITADTDVAVLSSTDPDGDPVEYIIQSVADASGNPVADFNGLFDIEGDTLVAKGNGFDFETNSQYTVTVAPVDQPGSGETSITGQAVDIVVDVSNVNEVAPTIDLDDTGTYTDVFNANSDSWGYNAIGLYVMGDNGPEFVQLIQDYSDNQGADGDYAGTKIEPGDLLTRIEGGETPHFFILNSGETRHGAELNMNEPVTFTDDGNGGWIGTAVDVNGNTVELQALFDEPTLNPYDQDHFRIDAVDADGTQHISFEEFLRNAQGNYNHARDWDDVRFTVQSVSDDTTGFDATYVEGSDGVSIAGNMAITDADSSHMSEAVITLTNAQPGDALDTSGVSGLFVDAEYGDGVITVTLSGEGTAAEYQQAIEAITFSTTTSSGNEDRTVTVQVADEGGHVDLDSNVATTTIAIAQATASDGGVADYDVTGGGQEVSFVADNAGYSNMLGVYTLDEFGNPSEPEIILTNSDTAKPNSVLSTFAADESIRFFLIPDGADLNIDETKDLFFTSSTDSEGNKYWDLSATNINGEDMPSINVLFDDTTFNPGQEDSFWANELSSSPGQSNINAGTDMGVGILAEEGETVQLRIDDIDDHQLSASKADPNAYEDNSKSKQGWADDDDDFNDLVINVKNTSSEDGEFNGTDGNDVAFGGAGDDTLDGGAGNDLLVGGDGQDLFLAGTGDDTIEASGGDTVNLGGGADGNDTIVIDPSVVAGDNNELIINDFQDGDTLELKGDTVVKDIIANDEGNFTELLVGDNDSSDNDIVVKLMGVDPVKLDATTHVDVDTQADDLIQYMIDSSNDSGS